jgi:hypothetical protein
MTTTMRMCCRFCIPALFALLLSLAAVEVLNAQTGGTGSESDFAIESIELDDADYRIVFYLRALKNGAGVQLTKDDFKVFETGFGGAHANLQVVGIQHEIKERVAATALADTLNILFLTGVGSSATPEVSGQRNALIQKAVETLGAGAQFTNYYLATYGDDAPVPAPLDISDIPAALSGLDGRPDQYAQLYRGIVQATRFMRERSGKWVLFVFTDGQNRENPAWGDIYWPYELSDLNYFLKNLSHNTYVAPIGIGSTPDTAFLRFLSAASYNPNDTCAVNALPPGLRERVVRRMDILYNNIVRCRPSADPVFRYKEPRRYAVYWHWARQVGLPDSVTYVFQDPLATQSNPHELGEVFEPLDWLSRWGGGVVGVLFALFAMQITMPWISKRNFRKKFVKPYRSEAGRIQRDPVTGDVFQEGQLVVVQCARQTTSLESWEYVGNKCPNYPKCLDNVNPCDGAGAPLGNEKFFSSKGSFRRLNWLWFGMVGGLIGWSAFALLRVLASEWYNGLLLSFWGSNFGVGNHTDADIKTLTDETLLGATFGAGLCFMLSWAEERGQPRKISWLRIILRTVFGGVASLFVFMLGFFLQYKGWIENLFFSGLVTWLLFGLVVGAVLTMRSAITLKRGILGGLAAAVAGYAVYALGNAFPDDPATVKLISFILLGGLLGLLLVTVVSRADDFELEYVSPEQFRQINPISKWLKNGIEIFIGRESGNYVYVKWDDEAVQPYHARLFYDKGTVYIEPLAETLLNGKMLPLRANTALRHGDLLQLGRQSNTRMRYREKRRSGNFTLPPANGGGGFRIN